MTHHATPTAVPVRGVTRLLKPTGRVNRTTYAATCLCGTAAAAAPATFLAFGWTDITLSSWRGVAGITLVLPFWLWIVTSVKRLHDIGLSGVVMLFALTPLAGPAFLWIVCVLAPGDGGPNVYGPEPRRGLGW